MKSKSDATKRKPDEVGEETDEREDEGSADDVDQDDADDADEQKAAAKSKGKSKRVAAPSWNPFSAAFWMTDVDGKRTDAKARD